MKGVKNMNNLIGKEYFDKLSQTIVSGEREECLCLINEGLNKGMDPVEAIEKGLTKGIKKVGDDFGVGNIFLPDLIMAAEIMMEGVAILEEKIKAEGKAHKSLGRIVIGTAQGDVHDIGKNIVKLFLDVEGFKTIDLGKGVPVRTFIETAKKENADIIAVSALMTTTMLYMPELIKQLKERGLRDQFKVIVGGAPVIKSWAEEIGADGYGVDASEAVKVASKLIKERRKS
jgi:corrinoid protein of di/trimethylamine methyltransferase